MRFLEEICPLCFKLMNRVGYTNPIESIGARCLNCGVSNWWNFEHAFDDDRYEWFAGEKKVGPNTDDLVRFFKLRSFE